MSIALTSEGIDADGNAYISWSDIEKVGIVSIFSTKLVGIRLRSYDGYLDRMSPSLAESITKFLPYMKLISRAASLLDVPTAVHLWSKLQGHDLGEGLKGLAKVGNLCRGDALVKDAIWLRSFALAVGVR